jgi:hypothetical protein
MKTHVRSSITNIPWALDLRETYKVTLFSNLFLLRFRLHVNTLLKSHLVSTRQLRKICVVQSSVACIRTISPDFSNCGI